MIVSDLPPFRTEQFPVINCDISAMKIEKTVSIAEIKEIELSHYQKELVRRSVEAAGKAYAPYSQFYVGCTLLLENGEYIEGNNQENAAFPSGLCAERVAIFHAGAQYPNTRIVAMAVTAQSDLYKVPDILCPCGACLQVISESEKIAGKPIEILLHAHGRTFIASGVGQFLPFDFELKS